MVNSTPRRDRLPDTPWHTPVWVAHSCQPSTRGGAVRADGASSSNLNCTSGRTSWCRTSPAGAANACPPSRTSRYFTLRPDWLCEILSPSTSSFDRAKKLGDLRARGRAVGVADRSAGPHAGGAEAGGRPLDDSRDPRGRRGRARRTVRGDRAGTGGAVGGRRIRAAVSGLTGGPRRAPRAYTCGSTMRTVKRAPSRAFVASSFE